MKRITLDNIFPADDLIDAARSLGYEFARVSVTDREVEGTGFQVHLGALDAVPESGVFGESRWGQAVWSSDDSPLEEILAIVSNGSFPSDRARLSEGQKHQLRDAMILEAHLREGRDVLVTNDERHFIRHGRREKFESRFGTKILTKAEFQALVDEVRRLTRRCS